METLTAENDSRAILYVTHLDEFLLPAKSSEVALMLIHEAHQYINNPREVPELNSALFYKAGLFLFGRLRKIYGTLDRGQVATFFLCSCTSP